jgi:hypothetical protein
VQVAAAPLAVKKMEQKRVVNPLFEKRAKNFGIGQVGPHFPTVFPHPVLNRLLDPDSNGSRLGIRIQAVKKVSPKNEK